MTLISGGGPVEARLSLRHVVRVMTAMSEELDLKSITVAICYATSLEAGQAAEEQWKTSLEIAVHTVRCQDI